MQKNQINTKGSAKAKAEDLKEKAKETADEWKDKAKAAAKDLKSTAKDYSKSVGQDTQELKDQWTKPKASMSEIVSHFVL